MIQESKESEARRLGPQAALSWALIHHDAALAREALRLGAQASAEDVVSALRQAAGRDWRAGVEMAIKAGASPDAGGPGRSLLERALEKGATRCVRFLLPLVSHQSLASALSGGRARGDERIERSALKEMARREAGELAKLTGGDRSEPQGTPQGRPRL